MADETAEGYLPGPGHVTGDPGRWDELVELQVLADHGDRGAAEAAERWLACDERARRRWERVRADCDQVRTGSPDDLDGPGSAVDPMTRRVRVDGPAAPS